MHNSSSSTADSFLRLARCSIEVFILLVDFSGTTAVGISCCLDFVPISEETSSEFDETTGEILMLLLLPSSP